MQRSRKMGKERKVERKVETQRDSERKRQRDEGRGREKEREREKKKREERGRDREMDGWIIVEWQQRGYLVNKLINYFWFILGFQEVGNMETEIINCIEI